MSKQKQKGTRFERAVADYLAAALGEDIDRAPLAGVKDCGDIAGVKWKGRRVVIECKNTRAALLSEQMKEAQKEAQNAGAAFGVLIKKRARVGDIGKQYAIIELVDFVNMLKE